MPHTLGMTSCWAWRAGASRYATSQTFCATAEDVPFPKTRRPRRMSYLSRVLLARDRHGSCARETFVGLSLTRFASIQDPIDPGQGPHKPSGLPTLICIQARFHGDQTEETLHAGLMPGV